MVSIQTIAKEAGVSVATVSRVMNGSDSVRPETCKKVREVMEKYNYQPNFSARNLRKMETRNVLVLMSSIVNPFLAKVVKGIEDASEQLDYHTLVCTTYDSQEKEKFYLDMISKRFADGAIMIGSNLRPQELRKTIGHIPIVQCSEYIVDIGIPRVSIDNKKAAYEATEHLIRLGRRKIAHITVDNHYISSRLRLEGYRQALDDYGIEFDPDIVITGNYGYKNALRQMNNFFDSKKSCDAIFAISDRMAASAIKSAQNHGFKVPDDIAVVGFDNIDICYITEPNITTVSQREHEMGSAAMNMLARLIAGKETCEEIVLSHYLIERGSSVGHR